MKIEFTERGQVGIIRIIGRLDASNEKELKRGFKKFLDEKTHFIYDFSQLEYIDSTGLGAIIATLKSVNEIGGDIFIAELQEKPRMLFEITRASKIFEVFDDLESAIEAISSGID